MDILFENKYYFNKKNLIEYAKDIPCKYIRILGYFFLIISLLYFHLSFKSKNLIITGVAVLLCIISLRLIFYHLVYINTMEKTSLTLHNGVVAESIFQFTENDITLKEGKILMEFEYNQIKKIKEYKSTYVLMIGKNNGILLEKNNFTIGNFEDFKKFIAEKSNIISK